MDNIILECKNINKKYYKNDHEHIACNNVSFNLKNNECFGIVGESGSGKSTLAKLIMNIDKADSGEIIFENKNVTNLKGKALRNYYKDVQMVFQDAIGSFNPKMTIGKSILEYNNEKIDKEKKIEEVYELLTLVGLSKDYFDRYPKELSGGQCQRAAIARVLVVKPKIIIFDEATSALDVSVQAHVIELLVNMRKKYNISYLFISHDLSLVSSFCERLAIVNKGEIVEIGNSSEIIANPKDKYTKKLLSSILRV